MANNSINSLTTFAGTHSRRAASPLCPTCLHPLLKSYGAIYIMCKHQLSSLKSFFASGPFKFACENCGAKVYREHPKAAIPWNVLVIDRIGILFLALVFLLFESLPIATAAFFFISFLLYLIDLKTEPLKSVNLKEERKSQNQGMFVLVMVVVVLIAGLGAYLWQP